MAEIDNSSIQDFIRNPQNYVLRVDKGNIRAEEKGLWTFIKANVFYVFSFGRYDPYRFSKVIQILNTIQSSKPDALSQKLIDILKPRITKYNKRHETDLRLIVENVLKGPEVSSTPNVDHQRSIARKAQNLPQEAVVEIRLKDKTSQRLDHVYADGYYPTHVSGTSVSNSSPIQIDVKDIESISVLWRNNRQKMLMEKNILPLSGITSRSGNEDHIAVQDFLKNAGVKFAKNYDDNFLNVQFPTGWKKEASDHGGIRILNEKNEEIGQIRFDDNRNPRFSLSMKIEEEY